MRGVAEPADSGSQWAIPRPVLRLAVPVALLLLAPLVACLLLVGPSAALAMSLGYTVTATAATRLPRRYAMAVAVPGAMAAVVAVSVNGAPLASACFVALACLLVAPADQLDRGLLAGIPTVATLLAGMPVVPETSAVGLWTLAGGLVAVAVLGGLPRTGAAVRIPAATAWRHAVVMAASAGLVTGLSHLVDVPRGYWIAMTLTVVLRPFGHETRTRARQRVAGTVGGALIALALAAVLPGWAQLVAVGVLLVLLTAYSALDRYALYVMCLTPIVVLLTSGGSRLGTAELVVERVGATLLAAVVAAGIAAALARIDASSPDAREADDAPGLPSRA